MQFRPFIASDEHPGLLVAQSAGHRRNIHALVNQTRQTVVTLERVAVGVRFCNCQDAASEHSHHPWLCSRWPQVPGHKHPQRSSQQSRSHQGASRPLCAVPRLIPWGVREGRLLVWRICTNSGPGSATLYQGKHRPGRSMIPESIAVLLATLTHPVSVVCFSA